MKSKLIVHLILIFSILSGCIAEDYDFTPPSIALLGSSVVDQGELAEANIKWDSDKAYRKETEDISSLAKEQEVIYLSSGEQVQLVLDNQDFLLEDLSAYVMKGDERIDLRVSEFEFVLPEEQGEFVLVVDLLSDRGSAQYVGNIIIN